MINQNLSQLDHQMKKMRKFFSLMAIASLSLAFVSCFSGPSTQRTTLPSKSTNQTGGGNTSIPGGNGSTTPDNSGVDTGDGTGDTSKASVELRFFIDPFTGSAQTKLTLPKNFQGTLYIAGNNLTSLQDAFVDVNFKFGINSSVLTARATVAKAKNGGIIPQTDTDVLVLNFTTPPFKNLALPYDLYDYNDYATDETPIQDPRNIGLYCRGLRLEDDPTFSRNSATGCNLSDDECLYAYAKVNDSNFYKMDSSGVYVPIDPSNPQVDLSKNGYATQSLSSTSTMCLPDSGDPAALKAVLGNDASSLNLSYGSTHSIGGNNYKYMGPYYGSSTNLWQIKDAAMIGTKGLFRSSLNGYDQQSGIQSMLFPLATKMNLRAGIEYFGAASYVPSLPFVPAKTVLSTAGESLWMDGCNARATSKADYNGESIASCNVIGSIELVVTRNDGTDGAISKEVVATSKNLKLQIIRASDTDYLGNETVISSFKTCNSSSTCGADECCYNKRCWSKSIVYQCVEDTSGTMTGTNGSSCESDYQCQSLCCNPASQKCQEHNPDFTTPLYCAKPAGGTCVAKDWCEQMDVQVCKVYKYKEDFNDEGVLVPVCGVFCLPEKRFGDCISGTCQAPVAPEAEKLDSYDCSQAPSLN